MADPKLELLRKVPLFIDCDRRSMDAINQRADEVDLRDGTVLARQGDIGNEFFLVLSGSVRIERDGQVISHLGPGDFLGEIALVYEGRRTATATAEGPVRAAVLTHQAFDALMEEHPALSRTVMLALAGRVRQLERDAVD